MHRADPVRNGRGTVAGHPELDVGLVPPGAINDHRRRTPKISERVAVDIVRHIVAEGLRTGDRLPLESVMLDQYGVSRSSLREALRLLEVQGLIHLKPGPGGGPVAGTVQPEFLARTSTLFFHLGAATYGDLLQTQGVMEPLCAQLAASHHDRHSRLEPYLVDVPPHDGAAYRDTTIGFHRTIYALADNPVLTLLTQAVTHIVSEHVVATMDPVELRPAILDEHRELARVIVAGDGPAAHRLTTDHFRAQHDYYRVHWPARLGDLIEWR